MRDSFPFFYYQQALDEHGAAAVAMALARMGPAFQILDVSSDEQGFIIDGLQQESIEPLWLEELTRQALGLWSENWSSEAMVGENLREFWRYHGQKVRARRGLDTVVDVVTIQGLRELRPATWPFNRPKIDGIGWFEPEPLKDGIKGHRERVWRLSGRVLPNKQARRWLQKNQKFVQKTSESFIAGRLESQEIKDIWKLEGFFKELMLESAEPIFSFYDESVDPKKDDGWYWQVERNEDHLRAKHLWQEPFCRGIDWYAHGSFSKIQPLLTSRLQQIHKLVNMLGLEVRTHLLLSPNFPLESCGFPQELMGEVERKGKQNASPELAWTLLGYDPIGVWWPLSRIELTLTSTDLWKVQAQVVISFERWLAAYRSRS